MTHSIYIIYAKAKYQANAWHYLSKIHVYWRGNKDAKILGNVGAVALVIVGYRDDTRGSEGTLNWSFTECNKY